MRHSDLDALKIRCLVKSSEGLPERANSVFQMFVDISDIVKERFGKNKRLADGVLEKIVAACDDAMTRFKPLSCRYDHRPATRARPKGERFESCYSLLIQPRRIEGFDDFYQLCSMRIYATRKNLRIDFIVHPAAFQYHAAERLLERAIDVDDALDRLGRSLSEWLPYIYEAEGGLMTDGACCVPVGENTGMMIGEFTDQKLGAAIRYDFGKHSGPMPKTPGYFALNRTFVARTFVSRMQLRPSQAHAMKLLSDWNAEFGSACRRNSETILWPWSMDDDLESDCDSFEVPAAALRQIIKNPVFVRSMHRSPEHSRSLPSNFSLAIGDWGPTAGSGIHTPPGPLSGRSYFPAITSGTGDRLYPESSGRAQNCHMPARAAPLSHEERHI